MTLERLEESLAKTPAWLAALHEHGIAAASGDLSRWAQAAFHASEIAAILAVVGGGACVVLWRARRRWFLYALLTAALVAVCAGAAGVGNWLRTSIGGERVAVLDAQARRPGDPWPRGAGHVPAGHVPLGAIGAAEIDKGYIETGGSFSPWFASFGLSFWIVGDDGKLIATSDDIAAGSTAHRYQPGPHGEPGMASVNEHYSVQATVLGDGRRRLDIVSLVPAGRHIEVALRGVGPAGGALNEISVEGRSIVLNRRWSIDADRPLILTYVGEEGTAGWLAPMPAAMLPAQTNSATGWAHARFKVPAGGLSLTIADPQRLASSVSLPTGPSPELSGVDRRFADSLRSQVETLHQGLVGDETRPGDPIAYPLEWLRDGAFVAVALARSGEVDLARKLARRFALHDFFGGYGAEADAPGLALWALGEVDSMQPDAGFEQQAWADVERKATLIEEMLHATTAVRHDFAGPLLPRLRASFYDPTKVALPARDGLISGVMDFAQPVFYVNAVSYSGLVAAAQMARRLGHDAKADAWEQEAAALRDAWRRAFLSGSVGQEQVEDDHTFVFSLWPAELAPPDAYAQLLERRWATRRDASGAFRQRPAGTYFDIAEAHQWLRLGRPDRAWSTLNWFWDQQSMPGLFTLWEGASEKDTFNLWKRARGWVAPTYVTPHYWSSAEMLLLQLSMLVEVEGEGKSRTLVVGAGVPKDWLSRPIHVAGVWTSLGKTEWSWKGGQVSVVLPKSAKGIPIRLGAAFPRARRSASRPRNERAPVGTGVNSP